MVEDVAPEVDRAEVPGRGLVFVFEGGSVDNPSLESPGLAQVVERALKPEGLSGESRTVLERIKAAVDEKRDAAEVSVEALEDLLKSDDRLLAVASRTVMKLISQEIENESSGVNFASASLKRILEIPDVGRKKGMLETNLDNWAKLGLLNAQVTALGGLSGALAARRDAASLSVADYQRRIQEARGAGEMKQIGPLESGMRLEEEFIENYERLRQFLQNIPDEADGFIGVLQNNRELVNDALSDNGKRDMVGERLPFLEGFEMPRVELPE